jgi:hypothetical protein
MNILTTNNMKVLALILSVISVKLYLDQLRTGYTGMYKNDGSYKNISPLKHDMLKSFFVDMFPLLIYGAASGEKFYDTNDFLGSILGKSLVVSFAYFVFYIAFEPNVMERTPNW